MPAPPRRIVAVRLTDREINQLDALPQAANRSEAVRLVLAWWLCPNEPPCPHAGVLHDAADGDDARPLCTVDGCGCGQPGGQP